MRKWDKYTYLLLDDIQVKYQRGFITPKDFSFLVGEIYSELHEHISVSTLKRLWGYSKYLSSPSTSTLSTLSRLVGFHDWADYVAHRESDTRTSSSEVLSDCIVVSNDLHEGDIVRLTWNPRRICDVEYHGNGEFKVLASQNTSIKVGDWFCCSLIVSGEPLWINNLRSDTRKPVAYVCGKQGGVRFEILNGDESCNK